GRSEKSVAADGVIVIAPLGPGAGPTAPLPQDTMTPNNESASASRASRPTMPEIEETNENSLADSTANSCPRQLEIIRNCPAPARPFAPICRGRTLLQV